MLLASELILFKHSRSHSHTDRTASRFQSNERRLNSRSLTLRNATLRKSSDRRRAGEQSAPSQHLHWPPGRMAGKPIKRERKQRWGPTGARWLPELEIHFELSCDGGSRKTTFEHQKFPGKAQSFGGSSEINNSIYNKCHPAQSPHTHTHDPLASDCNSASESPALQCWRLGAPTAPTLARQWPDGKEGQPFTCCCCRRLCVSGIH